MTLPARRFLYGLLSPRSLPYSRICLRSLFRNSLESLSLTLITDKPEDKVALTEAMEEIGPDPRHVWRVADEAEADARAEVLYAKYPHIRQFRKGNPCWRKITDPSLFAEDGQEMVVLDPDVYFPNPFRFEATPPTGLLMMWQPSNCLFPHEVVRHAFDRGIRMADHVDFGVSQATFPFDHEWLDRLIEELGGETLPAWSMHVEPIVWAAMAMQVGGGYLDPKVWFCFNNPVTKRLRVRVLKVKPMDILRAEPIQGAKCFHAGGKAKKWLVEAEKAGLLQGSRPLDQAYAPIPYKLYTRAKFDRKMLALKIARSLGVMSVVGGHD